MDADAAGGADVTMKAREPRRERRARAIRSGAIVAGLGALTVLPIYALIYRLQANDDSAAAIGMASMHMNNMSVYWSFPILQASGIAALLWAYLGVALGLLESGRQPSWLRLSRPQVDRIHRQISLLVIGLILVHALATAYDAMGDSLVTVFVPWQESWQAAVFAYNIGIFALYLAVLIGPTYYLRRRIGPVRWRFVHRFAVVVYILSVWHTLLLGLDFSHYPWARPVTWLAQIPLLVLFIRRLIQPSRRPAANALRARINAGIRYTLATVAAAGIVAIVILVANGHANLPRRVGSDNSAAEPFTGSWLPAWLGIVIVVALCLIVAVHASHLARTTPRRRPWHAAHIVMALGMIDMFLPMRHMPVGAGVGEAVFGVAALVIVWIMLAEWTRGRGIGLLWVITMVDLALMTYMFAMPGTRLKWLSVLAIAWFAVEATWWSTGRLARLVDRGGFGYEGDLSVPVGAEANDPRALPEQPASETAVPMHGALLRVSLCVMCLAMAYMLVVMQFAMSGSGGGGGSMPGMGNMPGM
jgi:DMSO/TMAO reductase YedYZ heme-binding membrane subunit